MRVNALPWWMGCAHFGPHSERILISIIPTNLAIQAIVSTWYWLRRFHAEYSWIEKREIAAYERGYADAKEGKHAHP